MNKGTDPNKSKLMGKILEINKPRMLIWNPRVCLLSDSAAADLDFFCTLFSHDDFFIKYQKFWSFLTI